MQVAGRSNPREHKHLRVSDIARTAFVAPNLEAALIAAYP